MELRKCRWPEDFDTSYNDYDQDIVEASSLQSQHNTTSTSISHPTSATTLTDLLRLYPTKKYKHRPLDLHVNFNEHPEIILIPKRFCTFAYPHPRRHKQTFWKFLVQHNCEQVKLNPTVFKQAVRKLKFKPSAECLHPTHIINTTPNTPIQSLLEQMRSQ